MTDEKFIIDPKVANSTKVLDEWREQTMFYRNLMMETHLRALLKPAPKYIPEKLWLKLATRFIVLEEKTTQGTSLAS